MTFELTMISKFIPPLSMIFLRAKSASGNGVTTSKTTSPLRLIHKLLVLKMLNLRTANKLTEIKYLSWTHTSLLDLNSSECSSETCAISSSLTIPSYSDNNDQIHFCRTRHEAKPHLSMYLPEHIDECTHAERRVNQP